MALIGPGGIGKTSIALTVLNDDRIKTRFKDNRRFIRCDQFPASRAHLLNRLSQAIGAGVDNPEDLTPLRPFLSSREMILFLDNAESILDPRGADARGIYTVVEELSQLSNVSLCITSRVSTTPPDCRHLDVPTLSINAARHTFYHIYNNSEPSDLVNGILEQLDFHPLSITLLATVARHHRWDINRLGREWGRRRTNVLHTRRGASLATAIELSLASPMFRRLGPDARRVLGVVAFFPQGIDENNLKWLFPTLSNRTRVFDNFCTLSLTYRCNGFITMLAPLRDYLYPKDPASCPLLRTTKDCYSTRLSVDLDPGYPGFEEAQWIVSEDVNIEHLLDVFTSIDADSIDIWDTCACFMDHLLWHKPRLVVLGPRIEALPDDHPSKPECLCRLSRLFRAVGNNLLYKQLLCHALELWRRRGNDLEVAETLRYLSEANRHLGLYEEGIERADEALEMYEWLNFLPEQGHALLQLASLLYGNDQLDAAEEAALRAIDLLDERDQYTISDCHRVLGKIYGSRDETRKAIIHFETALRIASSFSWHALHFWVNYDLANLFFGESRFDDAHAYIERAKSHAINDPHDLALAMELEARGWYQERRFEEARSEALRAVDAFEKLGDAEAVEDCGALLQDIEEAMNEPTPSGEILEIVLRCTPVNSLFSARGTIGRRLTSLFRRVLPQTARPRRSGGKRER